MWWFAVFFVVWWFYYFKRRLSYFSSRGVKTLPPVPFLGNLTAVTFGRENIAETIEAGYAAFADQRYFGIYQYSVPSLVLRDPALIRQIMVRDFPAFTDRGAHIGPDCDPLLGRCLIFLDGSNWRSMRGSLSPAFTTARNRSMTPLMAETARAVAQHLTHLITHKQLIDINTITMAYMNDIIASCAFGFAVNTLEEPSNCLFRLGKKAILHETKQVMKIFGYENMKSVMKFLNIKIVSTKDAEQFSQLFKSALKTRRENLVKPRPDFIQLLVDVAQGKPKQYEGDNNNRIQEFEGFTDDDLVAQAVLFYVAGYDTTSNLINYFLYEMAANPHIQDKLFDEIKRLPEDDNIENLYETVQALEYLDMCVSEVLRLWPLISTTDRKAFASYDFGPTDSSSKHKFVGPAGMHVWIPIYSIHRDEKYWPEPNKCVPERFAPDKKCDIIPYTYIPFGTGPRHCIGSRFALLVAKVFLVKFVRMYRTRLPPGRDASRLSPKGFVLRPADGFHLIVEPRCN